MVWRPTGSLVASLFARRAARPPGARSAEDGVPPTGLSTPKLDRFFSLCAALLVILGLYLRSRGYLFGETIPLWLDEAYWAIALIEQPLGEHLIRPIGFMGLTKALALLVGPSEAALRFMPWLAGSLTTILAPWLARRLFTAPAARLLFVAILALHPAAIDFAREYKPYALSLFFHSLLIFVALRYVTLRTSRALGEALGVALVSVLFAQDVIFAFPGFFLTVGIAALPRWRRHGLFTAGTAALLILVVLAQYFFIWSQIPSDADQYWGKKYNVFLSDRSDESYWSWWLGKYSDLAAFPGYRRKMWEFDSWSKGGLRQVVEADQYVWLLLHGLGVFAILWRRWFAHAALLFLPFAILTVFNYLGHWPFGLFRTNLFVLAYVTPIACAALDSRKDRLARWTGAIPALVLVLAPMFAFAKEWNVRKHALTAQSDAPAALDRLLEEHGPKSDGERRLLVLDSWACPPIDYYLRYHPSVSRTRAPRVTELFEPRCVRKHRLARTIKKSLNSPEDVIWVVSGKPAIFERVRKGGLKDYTSVKHGLVGGNAIYSIRMKEED